MKVFRDLKVGGTTEQIAELRVKLGGELPSGWNRHEEGEARLAEHGLSALGFSTAQVPGLPSAIVVLQFEAGEAEVTNIVPTESSELSYDQYNKVLEQFAEEIVRPAVPPDANLAMSNDNETLEDWISPEAAGALRRFSGAANKSTGASHPKDERRWFDFIIAVFQGGGDLSTDRLARWLVEEEGWGEEEAHKLARDYEYALALLRHYEE